MPLELEQFVRLLADMESRLATQLRNSADKQAERNATFASRTELDILRIAVQKLTERSLERTLGVILALVAVVVAVTLTIILTHH